MLIGALAPWFGGKRILGDAIAVELGKHTQFFEPFCGAMSVLFAKEPSQKETVNDLHGDLTNLARTLQRIDDAEELYDRLQRVIVSEMLLREAGEYLEDGNARDRDEVEWSYWYFLASWMQRNGCAGTDREAYQIATRWTKSGGSPTVRFQNAVLSIPAFHRRLQNVVVLKRDAFRIMGRFEDCAGTAVYCDPPYAADSRTGWSNNAGEHSRYRHEFDHRGKAETLFGKKEIDQHERLRDILARYKHARIVVSYYDCPRIRELYQGWTFIDKKMKKNLHVASIRGDGQVKDAPEVLILNGPSYARTA